MKPKNDTSMPVVMLAVPRDIYDKVAAIAETRKVLDVNPAKGPLYYCVEHFMYASLADEKDNGRKLTLWFPDEGKRIELDGLFGYLEDDEDDYPEDRRKGLQELIEDGDGEGLVTYIYENYGITCFDEYLETIVAHSNVFLTQEACAKHIEQNPQGYLNGTPCAMHAESNPEMDVLIKVIDLFTER